MQKFGGNVALSDILFTVSKRVSEKGYVYYVLVGLYGSESVDLCILSSEQEYRLYKAGVDIR